MVVGEFTQEADLLVIGGGPGGYTAAFRAAANGVSTTIVDETAALGGVCLQVGCIPSKALLNIAETIHVARAASAFGVEFKEPTIDVDRIRAFKGEVIEKLTKGLASRAKALGVEVIPGRATFEDGRHVQVTGGSIPRIRFRKALVATGSRPVRLPIEVESDRVVDSTGALALESLPASLLVIGGGYIGLELGQVHAALGTEVTVVEMMPSLLPGADPDLVRPLERRLKDDFAQICCGTKVTGMRETDGGVEVTFDGKKPPKRTVFDRVLVAVGRRPNTDTIGLDKTGVEVDERGFIRVDERFRTADKRIFAIGDVVGDPMLAHKAVHEGRIAADVIAGKDNFDDNRGIPAVVFTDPEIAWVGLTESDAKAQAIPHVVKKMPWGASGRAVAMGRANGVTKLICAETDGALLGVGIAGAHAGEMIAEAAHALEMGATATDLAATVHPHPTLSEMIGDVADEIAG